ncbi:MAG: hypothetical protein E7467_08530 [Ruminococcaceae bacterium]|nr:hypothetical protein [Oscillospiraceae bacterium]
MELNENKVVVCDIQFRTGTKIYYFDPNGIDVKDGDEVIIDTSRGPEFGKCVRGNHEVFERETVAPLRPVLRLATNADRKIDEENRGKEKRAHEVCLERIEALGLEMQLVSTEYAFDGSKILFFFTADGRVDFRELVRNLASVLRTRIELRQIGVRDKAKMVGGLGICGRPFCCKEFLEDFQPVSIKMAKTQSLSLNPTKISGTCGRLMCCLNYEQEAYEDLLRNAPKAESFVDTPDGRGTVTEVNLLRQSVKVRLEQQPDTIVCHKNCDICVLRNGKAKKTDEPIPEDLAPISGSKQNKQMEKPTFSTYLESVVLRSEKKIETGEAETPNEGGKHRNRRKPGRKPEKEAALSAKKAESKMEKPVEPKVKHEKPTETKARPEKPHEAPAREAAAEGAEKPKKKGHYYHKRFHKKNHKPKGDA